MLATDAGITPVTVAVDVDRVPLEVTKGDKVLYGKYSGTEITIDDKEYLILSESDILAVVE